MRISFWFRSRLRCAGLSAGKSLDSKMFARNAILWLTAHFFTCTESQHWQASLSVTFVSNHQLPQSSKTLIYSMLVPKQRVCLVPVTGRNVFHDVEERTIILRT
jgi:hypothetical protein